MNRQFESEIADFVENTPENKRFNRLKNVNEIRQGNLRKMEKIRFDPLLTGPQKRKQIDEKINETNNLMRHTVEDIERKEKAQELLDDLLK